MTPEQFARVERLFEEVCALPSAQRASFLEASCADDPVVLEAVQGMLREDSQDSDFDSAMGPDPEFFREAMQAHSSAGPSPSIERVGQYRILRECGRGGMATVFEAEQDHPRRRVALKMIRSDLMGESARRRFQFEAEVLGRLNHPGIARIFEAGSLERDGRLQPFFAMEFVEGLPLDRFAKERKLDIAQRLQLFVKVCDAVHHAHMQGVVHRDLKPDNILVRESETTGLDLKSRADSVGQPMVLDFGIARAVESDIKLTTMSTGLNKVIGTVQYMSPEQACGQLEEVDARSDIYSLGINLFLLLTGASPYELSGRSLAQALDMIRSAEPSSIRTFDIRLAGDIENIVHRALAKDPAERYESAAALGADICRYLNNEPILARPKSTWYQIRKFAHRNRSLVASILTAITALVAGTILSLVFAIQASHQRDVAHGALDHAREQEALALDEKRNVLRLSAIQELDRLEAQSDRLWPLHGGIIPEAERWLEDAERLIAPLRAQDDHEGHYAQLATLRDRAILRSPTERESLKKAHPSYDEWTKLDAELKALEYSMAVRRGEREPKTWELDLEAFPQSPAEIANRLLPWIDLFRLEFGREAEALALARHFEETYPGVGHWQTQWYLARALFANGLDDEALECAEQALEECPEVHARKMQSNIVLLESEIEKAENGFLDARIGILERQARELSERIAIETDWEFTSSEDRWWHTQLANLVLDLEAFSDEETGLIDGEHPTNRELSIRGRLALIDRMQRNHHDEDMKERWAEAIDAIADPESHPIYNGLRVAPQLGLVPLGADPESKLWEFADITSGTPPARDDAGRLILGEGSSLVLVLLPGGSFKMGAQNHSPTSPNYDPRASDDEGRPHTLSLKPFFLSKYEMTQAQWHRWTGRRPSPNGIDSVWAPWWIEDDSLPTRLLPVTGMDHPEATRVLAQFGFQLPTEAQWEYGARGGTTSSWWTGNELASMEGAGNICDQYRRLMTSTEEGDEVAPWSDGYVVEAPVGSFRANPFGLHDTIGNVWEWCSDFYGDYNENRVLDGNRPRPIVNGKIRAARGGCYNEGPTLVRSSYRDGFQPYSHSPMIGLRPARVLDEPE